MKAKLPGLTVSMVMALLSFAPSARANVLAYESSFSNFGMVDLTLLSLADMSRDARGWLDDYRKKYNLSTLALEVRPIQARL